MSTIERLLRSFSKISNKPLLKVLYSFVDGDERFVDRIILRFEKWDLVFLAQINDDTIEINNIMKYKSNKIHVDVSQKYPWKSLVKKRFFWGWITINQQGYIDGVQMSFENAYPKICLNVIASSIKVLQLNLYKVGKIKY